MTGPYDTPDHQMFIFGQQRADGWACRKTGCEWYTYLTNLDEKEARALHDMDLDL